MIAPAQAISKDVHGYVITLHKNEKPELQSDGRGNRIRTCDLRVPNAALYQTELHPEFINLNQKARSTTNNASRWRA